MADKSKYFTRSRANAGVILNIKTPEGGDAGDWLRVLGVDSDAFRDAKTATHRNLMVIAQMPTPEERKAATVDEELRLTATLVSGWSFDDPCTETSVLDFLREAPQVARQIDDLVYNRDRFFGVASSSLPDTQKQVSDSTNAPLAADSPSGQT